MLALATMTAIFVYITKTQGHAVTRTHWGLAHGIYNPPSMPRYFCCYVQWAQPSRTAIDRKPPTGRAATSTVGLSSQYKGYHTSKNGKMDKILHWDILATYAAKPSDDTPWAFFRSRLFRFRLLVIL